MLGLLLLILQTEAKPSTSKTTQRINFTEHELPKTLNPLLASTEIDVRVQEMIFDRLFYREPVNHTYVSSIVHHVDVRSPTEIAVSVRKN